MLKCHTVKNAHCTIILEVYHMAGIQMKLVIWHDASRSLEIDEILHIFPSGTRSMGDRGSKKAYTGPKTGIYLPTKFGCDQLIVVGCRSRNDRQTSRQTNRLE